MFVVETGAVLTLLFIFQAAFSTSASQVPITYFIGLDFWLFLTVLSANFATALAEARGKAQADSLRKTRTETPAYRLKSGAMIEEVLSTDLRPGDRIVSPRAARRLRPRATSTPFCSTRPGQSPWGIAVRPISIGLTAPRN